MNLVIMDVFPTPWSPRNTSLYFANGDKLGALADSTLVFCVVEDMRNTNQNDWSNPDQNNSNNVII